MSTKKRLGLRIIIWPMVFALFGAAVWFGLQQLTKRYQIILPSEPYCTASVNDLTVKLTPEQAGNAAIIVAEAQRLELPARAASIALTTAFQESGLRNLSNGHLDSVGLFQQRPSQDWGTIEQILDPWYASGRFYQALIKIPKWQTADINDIAQRVQISAFPQAYRKHVPNARTLASALTGETPAAFGCFGSTSSPAADLVGTKQFVERAFPNRIKVASSAHGLTLTGNPADLWSASSLVIATSAGSGAQQVTVASQKWTRKSVFWKGAPAKPSPGTAPKPQIAEISFK